MLEGSALQLLLQQALNLGEVEERHLDLVAFLHLPEDALQAVHVLFVNQSALSVAQRDVFLLPVLCEEGLQRHLLIA